MQKLFFLTIILTVNPIPTVAEKLPVWNFPVSNLTNSDVFPTPLSPNKIVWNNNIKLAKIFLN